MNGLSISADEFKCMPAVERDVILFNNTEYIKGKLEAYNLTKKIQYWWLSGLSLVFLSYLGVKNYFNL